MADFVPYAKRSKKAKREIDKKSRTTWGILNPVTRKAANKKVYNRKKARVQWKNDPGTVLFKWSRAFSSMFYLEGDPCLTFRDHV